MEKETGQKDEYRIEEDVKETGVKVNGKVLGVIHGSALDDTIRRLLGMCDGTDDGDDGNGRSHGADDRFKDIHTSAYFRGMMRSVRENLDRMSNLRLDINEYGEEEDEARFLFLMKRMITDANEADSIVARQIDVMAERFREWTDGGKE